MKTNLLCCVISLLILASCIQPEREELIGVYMDDSHSGATIDLKADGTFVMCGMPKSYEFVNYYLDKSFFKDNGTKTDASEMLKDSSIKTASLSGKWEYIKHKAILGLGKDVPPYYLRLHFERINNMDIQSGRKEIRSFAFNYYGQSVFSDNQYIFFIENPDLSIMHYFHKISK